VDDRDRLVALVDLLDSAGWKVVASALAERYNRLGRALDSLTDTGTLGDVRLLQGQRQEVRWLLKWPEEEIKSLRARLQ